MIRKTNYDSALWKTLEKNRVADLSQYHATPMFEEVPLYSRLSDISFLSDLLTDEANQILLEFSLKFLSSIVAYQSHRTPYLAAISVWNFSTDDPIVPNVFVWSGPAQKLRDALTLGKAKSSFARKIKRLAAHHQLHDAIEIFEESPVSNEMPRVFLGPSAPPYKSFLPLATLLAPTGSEK
jgi:hypothetical protein